MRPKDTLKTISIIIVLVIVGIAVFVFVRASLIDTGDSAAPNQVACTMEAKLCPDGSYVGRTGPNCEFAACPAGSPTSATISNMSINQVSTRLGLTLKFTAVLEDSRCPTDVVCIQAGTVRVNVSITDQNGKQRVQEFALNKPVDIASTTIELVKVLPARVSAKAPPVDYLLTFTLTKDV